MKYFWIAIWCLFTLTFERNFMEKYIYYGITMQNTMQKNYTMQKNASRSSLVSNSDVLSYWILCVDSLIASANGIKYLKRQSDNEHGKYKLKIKI